MLIFEPFSLEGLKRIKPYLSNSGRLCSDLTAGMLEMWHEGTDMRFCVYHDTLTIRQDIGEQPAFCWPVGADPDGMIDALLAYVREEHIALRFFAVEESQLNRIASDERLQPVKWGCDKRWSDYLYSFEQAYSLEGKKFSGQRNHINRFRRLYGEPAVRLLRPDDRYALERMLSLYSEEHRGGYKLEQLEYSGTRKLLDCYEELGQLAACLTVGDEIAAFSIGEIVGDMLVIHVEKALLRYEGAYPTMYHGFIRLAAEVAGRPLKLVNREDDSGNPGLRISKQQYHPIGMVDKFVVHAHTPAAKLSEIPCIRADGIVLTPMRETDKAAYYDLNADVENNRWWGYDYREDMMLTGPLDENTFYDSVQYDMQVGDSVNFAIRLTENGEMIGEGILWQFTEEGTAEIGCRLKTGTHGFGYGKAAFSALTEFGEQKLGLRCLARCFHENAASFKMITGSGYSLTKRDDTFCYFARP